jgi:hypothetical protein
VTGRALRRPGDERFAADVMADLEHAGFTMGDQMQLRFSLTAPGLRAAADLAAALRKERHHRVQVRPAPRRFLSSRGWSVIVTTLPTPVMSSVIGLWAEQMQDVVESHAGCGVAGWHPVVPPARAGE